MRLTLKLKKKNLVFEQDLILCLIVATYIYYMFWFQYSFVENSQFLAVIGLFMTGIMIFEIKHLLSLKLISPLLIFIGVSLVLSIFYSYSIRYTFMIITYLIPCLAVFIYAKKSEKKFKRVLFFIFSACLFLAISLLLKGTPTYDGALQLNSLNINQASNFLTFGLSVGLFLININEKKYLKKIILLVGVGILCWAQIMCASRRGFIVMLFLIVAYTFSILKVKYKKTFFLQLLITFSIIAVVLFIIITYGSDFSTLPVFQRIAGENNTGDVARLRYQSIAWALFKQSPLWGNGLGSVELYAGAYSHSMYYELIACTGLIGLGTILGYFFCLILKVNKIRLEFRKNNNNEEFYSLFMIWYIISILLSGVAMVFIYESYFYIMTAIVMSYIYLQNKKILDNR